MSTSHPEPALRWDVYEEHLDEAAFRWSQWEKALDAPDYTLAEVAELEELLAAHLDGLVLGGTRVARRLLEPALASDEPERVVAAALALLGGEEPPGPSAVLAALPLAAPAMLPAFRRALELALPSAIPAEFTSLLKKEEAAPELLALVFDTLSAQGLVTLPLCSPFFSHPEPQVAAAALRAAGGYAAVNARLPLDPGVVQRALESPEPVLRDAAIVAGLLGGHRRAWTACQAVAASPSPDGRLPRLLLALGGDERDTARLVELLSHEAPRPEVLWALGFTGSIAAAEACLEWMRQAPVAALAGEAFSAITGLRIEGPYATERQEPEAEESLDANLVPGPEAALPLPQADAVAEWWREARTRMDARKRYLAGQPWTPQGLLDALASAPMRRRHVLALDLELRSRGSLRVPTRAFAARQRAAWEQARSATPSSFSRSFAESLRG